MPRSAINIAIAVLCLIVVHRPDTTEVLIDTRLVAYVEAIQTHHNYAHGTHALIHMVGEKIAVTEQPHEVEHLLKTCEDGER
jgi:hypothetical protein